MSKPLLAGVTGCAAILLAAMLTTPAAARIQCRGNFQMTKYGPIATPYCEEEQIAFVARSYGQRVTAAEVHNNPLTKVYLCQTIGYDSTVEGILCGLRTGLLRPRSLTVARTRGVLNDCPKLSLRARVAKAPAQGGEGGAIWSISAAQIHGSARLTFAAPWRLVMLRNLTLVVGYAVFPVALHYRSGQLTSAPQRKPKLCLREQWPR